MKFKVGDRVYHRNNREYGVITKLTREENFPYRFEAYGGNIYNTADFYIELPTKDVERSIRLKAVQNIIQLESIGHSAIFKEDVIKIGCQSLSLEDAKDFVDKFNELYEEL